MLLVITNLNLMGSKSKYKTRFKSHQNRKESCGKRPKSNQGQVWKSPYILIFYFEGFHYFFNFFIYIDYMYVYST